MARLLQVLTVSKGLNALGLSVVVGKCALRSSLVEGGGGGRVILYTVRLLLTNHHNIIKPIKPSVYILHLSTHTHFRTVCSGVKQTWKKALCDLFALHTFTQRTLALHV